MSRSQRWSLRCLLVFVALIRSGTPALGQTPLKFVTHRLNPSSEFSACAVFDVDRDGNPDIYCGGFWYRGPDWERIKTRDVPQIRGRYDDYSNLPLDVDRDGWLDVISVNYRSSSIFWSRNPGAEGGNWETLLIDQPGPSETGRLYDINGDGQLDLLPNGTKFAAWYELQPGSSAAWTRHDLPPEVAGHGIGFGDLNGDGRGDLVTPRGWFEGPDVTADGRWVYHPDFELPRDCSVPILVTDVDSDGDQDLVFGRGHNLGVYWCEQVHVDGNNVRWQTHAIDTSWSSPHSVMLADLDRDGKLDLIAGKRYWGHDGKDPGEWDPLVVYAYQYSSGAWKRTRLSDEHGAGFDLDPAVADIDGDGDLDIVGPTRNGLYLLENVGEVGERPAPPPVLPRAPVFQSILTSSDGETETQITETVKWGRKRQQLLQKFQYVMGPLPSPQRRVPLDVQVESEEQAEGYRRLAISFQSEPGDRVPAFLLIPDDAADSGQSRPAMLCLHPTHPLGKAQICGLGGKPSRFYAHELARRGFVCLAPDYPSFGAYEYDFQGDLHQTNYQSGTMKAIWNNIRAVDLLEALPEVDRDKIGCIGHSLGGHNALFTAAFDQRLRVVATSCGFTSFARYYNGDLTGWTSDRYMPLIKTRYSLASRQLPFDFHEILAAIAPRPVFISAPVRDANFDNTGVREVVQRAQPVYQLFDKGELIVVYPEAEHDFPKEYREQMYAWLAEQLD